MLPSPVIRARLMREECPEAEPSEGPTEGARHDPCIYLACLEALKLMGVDVRRTKVSMLK